MHKKFYSSDPADSVDWSKTKLVEGNIVSVRRATVGGRKSYLMVVEQKGGKRVTIWESAGLQEVFENASVGDRIRIAYKGTVGLKNKREMRQFDVDLYTPDAGHGEA